MKPYTKLFFILSFLIQSSIILPMEKETQEKPMFCEELELPNEIWEKILAQPGIYVDLNIIDNAQDIYEAVDRIHKYLEQTHMSISLVCTRFKDLNISGQAWVNLKKQIRETYIPHLTKRYLERQRGIWWVKGLFPKGGDWDDDYENNERIALLINYPQAKDIDAYKVITHLLDSKNLKSAHVLLFFGVDPNINDNSIDKMTLLHKALDNYWSSESSITKAIKLLLIYQADLNIEAFIWGTPITRAIDNHASSRNYTTIIKRLLQCGARPNLAICKNHYPLHVALHNYKHKKNDKIIIILLKHGANPYVCENSKKNIFDYAQKKGCCQFKYWVRQYAQNTLKKICLLSILKNLDLYRDRLDSLPVDLKETINHLKY